MKKVPQLIKMMFPSHMISVDEWDIFVEKNPHLANELASHIDSTIENLRALAEKGEFSSRILWDACVLYAFKVDGMTC